MSIIDIKKQVRIVDYAEHIGFHPVRVGRWYSLKEHDSIRIDPEKNLFYRNSTGESGSIIDFIMAFSDKDLKGAIKELENFSGDHKSVLASCLMHEENKARGLELNLPQKADTNKNVYAYLTKTRGIDKDVVNWMIQKEYIYQDIHKNCVFVSYREGVPVFASLRGTNTYRRFVADVSGSDYTYGFFINGERILGVEHLLCVTESVIDLMSLNTIFAPPFLGDFLSLSGVSKTDSIFYHLARNQYDGVSLSLDNDTAGRKASSEIKEEILRRGLLKENQISINLPGNGKDWNEELLRGSPSRSLLDI